MTQGDRIAATETAFEILDVIHGHDGASAAEISGATGLSRAGVYKHLRTLDAIDAVSNRDGVYVIGPKLTDYGLARGGSGVVLDQTERIDELARSLDASTNLWSTRNDTCTCVHTSLADDRDGYPRAHGDTERLTESPPGKAILAHRPPERRSDLLGDGGDDLLPQLETLRERQLLEETLPDAPEWVSIATPVLSPSDEPVAAIEVVIPAERAAGIDVKNNIQGLLIDTANQIRVDML
ncbi:IclR family transcriptional regulator domain-containing protein [Halosimplex amylolyticum]|uniref:IclR family transcriptional regulator domain-containing protein n=1 Tax=Halosimplex amylolyticum TaxID=3396616 RepID=UPI003F558EB4